MKDICRFVSPALLALLLCVGFVRESGAHSSPEWLERLKERTATLWVEGQFLDTLVLNTRGELNVTWLERSLTGFLDQDRDVEDWLLSGLGHYSSGRREVRAKLKGKDVFILNYRAAKRWKFDPSKLVIDGYAVTPDDILTREGFSAEDELPPGTTGTLAICAPSLQRGRTVELRYEDTLTTLEVPRR